MPTWCKMYIQKNIIKHISYKLGEIVKGPVVFSNLVKFCLVLILRKINHFRATGISPVR